MQFALTVPTFEEKVAQRAIARVLEAVYEQDFLPCSYGFRPGRSAHQALNQLFRAITVRRQYWVLDVDIRKYFDSISHIHLREILDQRVTNGVIRRMIDKWLNAGVLEAGNLHLATEGTPQGGVISPILSNIFLHHVLDVWFEGEVKPRLKGTAALVRFADDFVMTFETYQDAKRVMDVLGKRLERFGLLSQACDKRRNQKHRVMRRKPVARRLRANLPARDFGLYRGCTLLFFTRRFTCSTRNIRQGLNSSGDISAIRDTALACAAVTCGSQADSSNISTVKPERWRPLRRQM